MTTVNDFAFESQLFHGFNEAERKILQNALQFQCYKSGENIVTEGELSEDIHFIHSGVVEVIKLTEKDSQVVAELSEHEHFGELAFLDGSPRFMTIRAKVDTEIYTLTKESILNVKSQESMTLLNKLHKNIAVSNSDKLRNVTSRYVSSLEKEVELLREQNYFNHFLITLIMIYSIMTVVGAVLHHFLQQVNVYTESFTWFYLILLVGPFLYFVAKSHEPWRAFGVTLVNWKRSTVEGLLIAISIIIIGSGLLSLVSHFGFFNLAPVGFGEPIYNLVSNMNPITPLYFLHSYAQEFLARGVFQNVFQKVFNDQKGWYSVLIAAWLFGLSHAIYGPALVVVAVISGIFFGFIFLRHQNLLGAAIVHFLLGSLAFSIPQLPFQEQLA